MATESTPVQTDAAITNGESAAAPVGEQKPQRERRQHTPPEELYDLTKPIPKENKPDKAAHDAAIEAINSSIDSLKEEKSTLQNKIENALQSNRSTAAGQEREAIKSLRVQKGARITEKKALQSNLQMIRNKTDSLMNNRKAAKANVRFSNVEKIDEEITRLKTRQETTSMSLAEEKNLIKEIESLQKSKDLVASFKLTDASIDDCKLQRKMIGEQLKAKDAEIDAVQVLIDEKGKILDAMKSEQSEYRDALDVMKKERDSLRQEIGDKMKERNDARDAFREANNKWYDFQRAIKAQRKMRYEEEKKKREEEDRERQAEWEAEEAKKIPYEEEQQLCTFLSEYLTRTYVTGDSEKKAEAKKNSVVALKEDPFAGFKPRKKGGDEEYLQVGKGKKKPRVRASKKKATVVFKLTVEFFEQFGVLGLNPPTSIEGVPKSIEELNEKKEWFSKQPRGSVPTASDIRKANVKEAQKLVGDKTSSKKNGKIDISSADFAPLSAGSSASAMNAAWGQKAVEEEIVVEPAVDSTVEPVEASA